MIFSILQTNELQNSNPGAIVLKEPIVHPGFIPYLKKKLSLYCNSCWKPLKTSSKCKFCRNHSKLVLNSDNLEEAINALKLNRHLLVRAIPIAKPETIPKALVGSHEISDVIEVYYDRIRNNLSDTNVVQTTWNKIIQNDPASFKERLSGKKGRFRYNLCGKRCNYSARCTLTPDPTIALNEIKVPRYFSQILLIPEMCTEINKSYLERLLISKKVGKIKKKSGAHISLNGSRPIYPKIDVGDKVFRHLRNGDFILCNRQPTLERTGIMAHKVILHDHNTCAINLAVCSSYGADFDGDEINLHCVQTIQARTELELLMDTYCCVEKCKPIQDQVLFEYLSTQKKEELSNAESWIATKSKHKYETNQRLATMYLHDVGFTVGWEDVLSLEQNCGSIYEMVDAKSKGKPANIDQIKSLYTSGLDSDNFFEHMREGRKALVQSSIMTAQTGYLQRCMIKNMEDIKMTWLGLRASKNVLVSFFEADYEVGDAVGIRIAQTVGEISTQLSLDSFHNIGNNELGSFQDLKKIVMGLHQDKISTINTLGVEAQFQEYYVILKKLLEVGEQEIVILLDWITWEGRIDGMNYAMLNRRSDSVFTKASFERTTQVLYEAAATNTVDPLKSVSSRVICGEVAEVGTGFLRENQINLYLEE